jgi:hypothetical protein
MQGVGFEPTYGVSRPGLQPGAINHSTTPAKGSFRAGDRTRTYDPLITNQMLYQLSYTGLNDYLNIKRASSAKRG